MNKLEQDEMIRLLIESHENTLQNEGVDFLTDEDSDRLDVLLDKYEARDSPVSMAEVRRKEHYAKESLCSPPSGDKETEQSLHAHKNTIENSDRARENNLALEQEKKE